MLVAPEALTGSSVESELSGWRGVVTGEAGDVS